jgi:hypothetical protein
MSIEPGRCEFKIGASSSDIKFNGMVELLGEQVNVANRSVYFPLYFDF